jgi:hypothetical protein
MVWNGSRLEHFGDTFPKALLPVSGATGGIHRPVHLDDDGPVFVTIMLATYTGSLQH